LLDVTLSQTFHSPSAFKNLFSCKFKYISQLYALYLLLFSFAFHGENDLGETKVYVVMKVWKVVGGGGSHPSIPPAYLTAVPHVVV